MSRTDELRKLRAGTLSGIVDILEIDNDWKKVMSIIPKDPAGGCYEPKYNIEHIRIIEEYAKATNQKCTEILFDEWGTSGRVRPTLGTLMELVLAAGIYRAGDEIATILKEPPPARPDGGPEQDITTDITGMLNASMQQQISTAQANDYSNKNVYQNQCTEPIQTVYYGVESVNTADLPAISALQGHLDNKPTVQVESVSDLMKFTTEQSILNNNQLQEINKFHVPSQTEYGNNAANSIGNSLKPSSNIDLDSVISQDANLIHFRYSDLEVITNNFFDNPPTGSNPASPGKIGSGGFGDVFVAHHPSLGVLAIKRASQNQLRHYKPEIVSKVFNSEVKYLSKFRHKNIVPILGYSVDGPAPCIICEYISGGSLMEKIAEKVLTEKQRINIMIGSAEGLRYLHTSNKKLQSKQSGEASFLANSDANSSANNFMHGDVKSANILLTKDFEPKLCDFGLAKQYEATCEVSSPMGTSAYMAPEGMSGTITQKLDIYSYGMVLLELLTGLKPIVDQNGDKINLLIYVNETCRNNDISVILDATTQWTKASDIFLLAKKCLQYERNDRPTMSVICDVLNDIGNEQ